MAFPASLYTPSEDGEEEEEGEEEQSLMQMKNEDDVDNHHNDTPLKFVPLCHVYSSTAPCVTDFKKFRARRETAPVDHKEQHRHHHLDSLSQPSPPPPSTAPSPSTALIFYSRRPKGVSKPSVFDTLAEKFDPSWKKRDSLDFEPKPVNNNDDDRTSSRRLYKRRRVEDKLTSGANSSRRFREPKSGEPPLSKCNAGENAASISKKRRKRNSFAVDIKDDDPAARKWVRLAMDGVNPIRFVGLHCQVYWPLDEDWYEGSIVAYDSESKQHNIKYDDGEEEDLVLSREKIKFYISEEEMLHSNLSPIDKNLDDDQLDFSELLVLAASQDNSQDPEPGDIIWAKLTGHAMWPAVIVDEARVGDRKGMNKNSGSRSVPVQFFGTHDFARIQGKHIVSFLRGLLSSYHTKCKSPRFHRSLMEAKNYLHEQKLPKNMLHLQHSSVSDDGECHGDDADRSFYSRKKWTGCDAQEGVVPADSAAPLTVGDLQIINFGQVVRDSVYFQDERTAWPLGYTALRKFSSIRDPSVPVLYKMEVLRDSDSKIRPLFRVTVDGEQFKGGSPSACWSKIFKRMRKTQNDVFTSSDGDQTVESGAEMFGFTYPEVLKLIKNLSKTEVSPEPAVNKVSQRSRSIPVGYRPVRIDWKDLDRCSVCHMDEEYETNLFLQCDKCRIMVHARCYGEEFVDGKLWLCNLCRPGAPEFTPPCCLCPVVGGAMKPTTDDRWAHLACAIWIPETCLNDIKRMEPIDGLNRINKDRWKLLCSICGVPYGACIQCSNNNCRVSYHPLCARAAGLCVELEDEDRLFLIPIDEDEEDQCIRLLSFCKKHKQPSNELLNLDSERVGHVVSQCSDYSPPFNPSGCARTEPYDHFGRRGRKEPEALAAASFKRLFLENRPYLVGGYSLHESLVHIISGDDVLVGSKLSQTFIRDNTSVLSVSEKYTCMRQSFRKRLAFGKSRIHGFGIFAKQPHKAGDMVVEYTGEIVRPPVADRREHFIYNSLVGAGTYMFRIDNDRVIDATRAGSIAHLINHSCEPNCYSRVITVNGDGHIIIFAKRDIRQWEELTYDYRFFSIDEQLPCYCGFPRCRGVVNDVEAEEQVANLYAPTSELVEFKGYP